MASHFKALKGCRELGEQKLMSRQSHLETSSMYISNFQYVLVTTITQGQCRTMNCSDKQNETWLFFSTVKIRPHHLTLYSYILFIC